MHGQKNKLTGSFKYHAFIAGTLTAFIFPFTAAQTNPDFSIALRIDYAAAEQCVELFEDRYVSTRALAMLPGNRIASSTAAAIGNRNNSVSLLAGYLDSLRYRQIIRDDIFQLENSRANAPAIKELLREMKSRNFSQRVSSTVEQIFPRDADITVALPVFVVALGHENVDAYVRRVEWRGDSPVFVGEGKGDPSIVINLAHAAEYGNNLEERFLSLLGVVAHEVFHASFSLYKEKSDSWKTFYADHRAPLDILLDLTQNEGIAYYLSLDQGGRGRFPDYWREKIRQVFSTFNKNAVELSSDTVAPHRVRELISKANLSGSWDNYGAMAGMVMAREIDLRLGRSALIGTISKNPYEFIKMYSDLAEKDNNLPEIDRKIIQKIYQYH